MKLDLLQSEQDFFLADVCPSIGSVTFFKGVPPIEYLKRRTEAIVAANPWLSSKHSKKGKDGSPPHMVYDPHNLPDLFQVLKGDLYTQLNKKSTYPEICKAAENLLVKKRAEERDEDKGSLLISLITKDDATEHDKFALVVSLSHVIGDGHTFYEIHNMLSSNAKVYSLDPIRPPEFPEQEKELMGQEHKGIADFAIMLRAIFGLVKLKSWSGNLKTEAYFVDERHIAEAKTSKCNLDGVDFISTNDILTSWFFSFPKVKLAAMAINLRSHANILTENHAGNYENFILYQPGDYENPARIRQSVQNLKPKNSEFPSFWTRCMKKPYAVTTNWSTFDKGVQLPGAQPLLHLPIYTSDAFFADFSLGVIFRPMKGKLGMSIMPDSGLPKSVIDSEECPLGEAIFLGQ